MTTPLDINIINSVESLLAINGNASNSTLVKKITRLERHSKRFIECCPFLILGTASKEGADTSPRGDAPGFVKCLDDTTLLVPERPGNRIADSLRNIIDNPELGMLLMIPGLDYTLRINGRGYVTDHAPYLEMLEARGKVPKLALVVQVTEIYFHCPKAYIRSELWNPETFAAASELPTLGAMLLIHSRS
jgi:PPOX class probable FMN-dependent enzyme